MDEEPKNGTNFPVYLVTRRYRNENGTPTSDRACIGKRDMDTGLLIPNSKYWKFFPQTQPSNNILESHESVRSIGGPFLVSSVKSYLGVKDILDTALGVERSGLMQTAASYMVARDNVFENVSDYCKRYTLGESLTSQRASDLFASITFDERMEFFQQWVDKQPPGEYLAYDVTSFSTYAKKIMGTEYGYNRDNDKLPQLNLGCYVSELTGLPVFYVTYPGSIVDSSFLINMMAYNEDLNITNVCFILDRGFCSVKNVGFMTSNDLKFILGVTKHHKTVRKAIDSAIDNIKSIRYSVEDNIYGRTVDGCYYGEKASMHVFFDQDDADNQIKYVKNRIEAQEAYLNQIKSIDKDEIKKYREYFLISRAKDGSFTYERDYEKIDAITKKCGFFCILTNTDLSVSDLLEKYKHKDVIEKSFDDIKNYIKMKKLRTHNTATTDGKLFCAFISLIIASEIGVKLRQFMKDKSWSKDHVIRELEKIEVVRGVKGLRLMNPVTKTQRLILEPFGLNEDDLNSYVTKSGPPKA